MVLNGKDSRNPNAAKPATINQKMCLVFSAVCLVNSYMLGGGVVAAFSDCSTKLVNTMAVNNNTKATRQIFNTFTVSSDRNSFVCLLVFGNGGSAAIASHFTVDLTKNARIRATNYNEADLITCLANDYGFEQWAPKAIEYFADSGDFIIRISSSGNSPNIVNGVTKAKKIGLSVINE